MTTNYGIMQYENDLELAANLIPLLWESNYGSDVLAERLKALEMISGSTGLCPTDDRDSIFGQLYIIKGAAERRMRSYRGEECALIRRQDEEILANSMIKIHK